MNKLTMLIVVLSLAACAAPRPNTAKSVACTAEARKIADRKELGGPLGNGASGGGGSTLGVMMKWLGDEEDAYKACMARP